MKINDTQGYKVVKQALTKETTIKTTVGFLWIAGALVVSLAAGWANLINQIDALDGRVQSLHTELELTQKDVKDNENSATAARINLAEINTRLTSIDATLIEIKANVGTR